MLTVIKLIKNTMYLLVAEIAKPFISFFLVVYISHQLGVQGMGQYSTVLNYLILFETSAALGLQNLIIRDTAFAQDSASAYLTACLAIGTATAGLSMILLNLLLGLFGFDAEVNQAIRVLGLGMPLIILTGYLTSFFEGLQRMEFKSLTHLVDAVLKVGLGVLAIRWGYGLVGLITAILISQLLVFALTLTLVLKLGILPAWPVDKALCQKLVKQSFTFLLITVVAMVFWKVDVLMLAAMQGMEDVGAYSAAYRLMEILKSFSYSYIAALFPVISSSYALSKDVFRHQCIMSIRYLFLLSFPVCIGTTILAEDLIVKIYGQAFISSVLSLQILIWIVSLFPVAMVFARALVASNHQTQDLVANILGVLFIVVLNYMLIPRYGFIGSAAAMLVSICLFTFVQYNFFRRVVSRIHASSLFWKPFCAGALMGVFTFYLRGMNIFLLIPLAACVYAGCLFLLQTFSPEEVDAMRSLYRNKFHSMLNRG